MIYSIRFFYNKIVIIILNNIINNVKINGNTDDIKMKLYNFSIHKDIYNDYNIIESALHDYKPDQNIELSVNNSIYNIKLVDSTYTKKHQLVAMTMIKNENNFLIKSYVNYYTQLGIEHFFIYYNGILNNVELPTLDNVTYIEWNYVYWLNNKHCAQIMAMTDFLYWAKSFSEYILFNDIDEYIDWKNTDISLKDYIINNNMQCYSFMNRFIKLTNPIFDELICDRINKKQYDKVYINYEHGYRSKCIIKTDIDSIGIHKIIYPFNFSYYAFTYEQAELLHICNFLHRKHVSINNEAL